MGAWNQHAVCARTAEQISVQDSLEAWAQAKDQNAVGQELIQLSASEWHCPRSMTVRADYGKDEGNGAAALNSGESSYKSPFVFSTSKYKYGLACGTRSSEIGRRALL